MSEKHEPPGVDWATVGPPARGNCARCRAREVTTVFRMFVQDRPLGGAAGKTLAGRAIRLCEPCARDVFQYTTNQAERAVASMRDPDSAVLDALAYAVAYLEADEAGMELNDALDIAYLRSVVEASQ